MSGFGVDLGNRFGTVAITRRGNADVCLNETSQRETPTVVSFGNGDGQRMIGEKGNDQATRTVKNTFPNLKRLLGVRWGSALHEHERKYIAYQTRQGKDGYIEVQGTIANEQRWFPVEQLLAMLLVHLRGIAENEAGMKVIDSVIAVPAYWTPAQRRRLAAAAATADYHLLNIISETTAAAVMYGWPRTALLPHTEASAERILLFDFGHSCTTVSVTAFWRDGLRTLFHVCDPYVGVRDMIHEVAEHFAVEAKNKFKYDVKENPRDTVRFHVACERAVRVLSANLETVLNCELPEADLSFPFSRELLEKIITPQLARIETILSDAVKAAGSVANVEVIGGGSRIPSVKALIERVCGQTPRTTLNASEAVARGAAMDGAFRSPKFSLAAGSFNIWDASSHPLCVMYVSEKGNTSLPELPEMNKRVSLLPLHEKLPKCLTLTFDRKETFELAVVHDPSDLVAQVGSSRVLGKWKVALPNVQIKGKKGPPVKVIVQVCPNGSVSVNSASLDEEVEEEVEETVEVDEDAPMDVDGEEKDGKKKEKKTEKRMVKRTTVRSHPCPVTQLESLEVPQAVINEWREEERKLRLHDLRIKEEAEMRNELEAMCFELRAQVGEGGELRQYMPASAVKPIEDLADKTLNDLEDCDWEGMDNYKGRRDEMQQLVKPYKDRMAAFSNVLATENDVTAKANAVRAKLQESKFDHLSAEDKATVTAAVDDFAKWGSEVFAALKSQSKESDPATTAADVRAKVKELDTKVNPIFAKPAPKAEAPAPAAAEGEDKKDGDAEMKPAA